MSEILDKDIVPLYKSYINTLKKMLDFQATGKTNQKLLDLYQEVVQSEANSDSIMNFLTAIIKDLLEPVEGNIHKSDIYKWNDGFGAAQFDFDPRIIKLVSIINILRTV
jgi:hypothetical protein